MIPHPIVAPLLTVEEAAAWCTAEEVQRAVSFGSERRSREFLTWRAVVRQQLGRATTIAYNTVGAPLLVGRAEQLSVSHGADRVAVLIVSTPCAVDIEGWGRNFAAIQNRYLSPDEAALSTDPRFLAVAWCAKECLYKLAGRRGLSLRDELHLTAFSGERIVGQIGDGAAIELCVEYHPDFCMVYTC